MDFGTHEDGGGGKKKGLARLAKTSSLSNLENLSITEKNENVDEHYSFTDDFNHKKPHPDMQQHSCSRTAVKHSGSVNLLPNKINFSALSGQNFDGKTEESSISEYSSLSLPSHLQSDPCSDTEFLKTSKSTTPEKNIANQYDQASVSEKATEASLFAHESHLSPPLIKRSSSMTYLTEAFSHVHNIFMFPAHAPVVADIKSDFGQPGSWYDSKNSSSSEYQANSSYEEECKNLDCKLQDSSLQTCRSASLDDLSSLHILPGLPCLSPADAKKRNYLFGGLGNDSILGSKELDHYLPNRTVTIFIATWNMNGKEPPLNLEEFLLPETMKKVPDIYVIGTQESGGSRSEWEVCLQATIGPSHALFTSAIFGVLHLTVFMRRDLLWFCSVPEEDTYSLRPGIAYKTKGGVAIGFQFFGTRILFINSHLTAHEEKQALRIQNFKNICQSLDLPRLLPLKRRHKDITHRYDCVFWLGDLNFRLAMDRDEVFEKLKHSGPDTYQHLLQMDQLSQARKNGEAFKEFEEGPITFFPTFKFDPGTDHYDTSSKQRVPSYTDRILFKSGRGAITCSSYDSCPLFRTSDHKPVSGIFQCKIRPGRDDVPLAAGIFNRAVFLEAIKRRKKFLYQPSLRNCPVQ